MDKWDLFLNSIRSSGSEVSAADAAALTRLLRGPKGERGGPGRDGPPGPPADAALLARILAVEGAVAALRSHAPAGLPPEALARLAAIEAALATRSSTGAPGMASPTIFSKGVVFTNAGAPLAIPAWRADVACRLVALRGFTEDASALPYINASRGAALHLTAPLMLTQSGTWIVGEPLQEVDYREGDTLELRLTDMRYAPVDLVAVQCDFMRTA